MLTRKQVTEIAARAEKVYPGGSILDGLAAACDDIDALCATIDELRELLKFLRDGFRKFNIGSTPSDCRCWDCVQARRIEEMLK